MFNNVSIFDFSNEQKDIITKKYVSFIFYILLMTFVVILLNWFHDINYKWIILKAFFVPIVALAGLSISLFSPIAFEKGRLLKFVRIVAIALIWACGIVLIPYETVETIDGTLAKLLTTFVIVFVLQPFFDHFLPLLGTALDRKIGWPENK